MVLACSMVCVCVLVGGWVSRCDQSATVDNWETQVSDVVDIHRVLVTLVVIISVIMVADDDNDDVIMVADESR